MARWDQPGLTWDSGLHYDATDDPASETKTTRKTRMKRQVYLPTAIGDQVVWLQNFKTKLPIHAAALGLDPAVVTARVLDADNGIYGLSDYRGALGPGTQGCYACIEENLYTEAAMDVAWTGFAAPTPIPAAVEKGCLVRIFDCIAKQIKTSPGYTTMIGEDLGVEGAVMAPPDPGTTVPEFSLRQTSGGKAEVVWSKGQFDGVKLEWDLGAAGGLKSDIDLRPNYTLNWLPASGESAVVRVRLLYVYKGEDFGLWSDWQSWTLTGS